MMNPQPETAENPTSHVHYDDLKYPLLRRGLTVPHSLADYIAWLETYRHLSVQEVEQIRTEMKHVFTDAGEEIPYDFDRKFNQCFFQVDGDATDASQTTPNAAGENVTPQKQIDSTPQPDPPPVIEDGSQDTGNELLQRLLEMRAKEIPDVRIAKELGISRGKLQYILKKHAAA